MKTIAGDSCFACRKRSRTREAPTPTIASTNSEADIEKNGAPASPATARARSVLPVPGEPAEQNAARDPAAEPAVLVRVAEEVDDLGQLLLRLVDAGDVGERDRLAARLVAKRAWRGRARRPPGSRSSCGRSRRGAAGG